MSFLLEWVVQPLALVFIGLLISQLWLLWVSSVPTLLKLLFGSAIGLLWLCSAPLTANALVWQVEKPRYETSELCREIQPDESTNGLPVVVLGADLDAYVDSENPYEVLSVESMTRTLHAATLDNGSNKFFLLGGGQTSRKLSNFMAQVLIDQGVDMTRIARDEISLSTKENAEQLASMIEPVETSPIILVTSTLHMNRAFNIFTNAGFTVCPSDTNSLYSVSAGWVGLLPYITGLNKTTLAWREALATVKYTLASLLPD